MTTLQKIGELIRTQDNRCTSDPLFLVQERRRIYGMNADCCEETVWIHCDGEEANEDEELELEQKEDLGEVPEEWTKTGYMDIWEFVTVCFTEKACEDYIAANGHNLNEPRIYATSAYRNRGMIAIREMLKST